ncbi:MAG TPA: DUF1540 domain-containing protein [Thermoanaerobacterales bacterium]|jgi:hypothetical protein|nr:DUF1540 domain-containing protein [Thermoanaerobacterales bacterium]
MATIKCNVSTCKYNKNCQCNAENVVVNAVRPECSFKEGTYCNAYERNTTKSNSNKSEGIYFWD